MTKKFMKILSGNLGDGWRDELEAAHGYANWIQKHYPEIETEVVHANGVGGGIWDEDGNDCSSDGDDLWAKFCGSQDAKAFFEDQAS